MILRASTGSYSCSLISALSPTFAFPSWHLMGQQCERWRSPEPPCGSESRTLCIAPRAACLQSKICIYPSRSSCLGAGLCGGEERPSHWEKESCWGWKWREDNLGSWKGFWKRERLDFQGSDNGAEMVWMCEKQAGKPLRVSLKTESGELFHRENHTGWVILWEWIGGKPGSGGLI